MSPYHLVLHATTLVAAFFLFIYIPLTSKWGKTLTQKLLMLFLGLISIFSIWGYSRYGLFHYYDKHGAYLYHYHDIYHYAFGSKYYKEMGYYNLYDCTYQALYELKQEGMSIPPITHIRSIRNPFTGYPVSEVIDFRGKQCKSKFSPKRWNEFKVDMKNYLTVPFHDISWFNIMWKKMLFDAGFNPPPSYAVIATPFINLFPIKNSTLQFFPLIDWFFLLFGAFLIYRAFGVFAGLGFLIILGNNHFAPYNWTGGSYLRHLWFFFLILGTYFMKKENFLWSGIFMGASVMMRLFPAFFIIGATIPMIYKVWKEKRGIKNILLFYSGAAIIGITLFSFSLIMFGENYWVDFIKNITSHESIFYTNHVGYNKLVTYSRSISGQNFWWVEGAARFQKWNAMLHDKYNAHKYLHFIIKFLLAFLVVFAVKKETFVRASILAGTAFFFIFTIPAHYYYIYMALFGAVFLSAKSLKDMLIGIMTLVFLFFVLLVPFSVHGDDIVQDGFINIYTAIFILFAVLWTGFGKYFPYQKFEEFILNFKFGLKKN